VITGSADVKAMVEKGKRHAARFDTEKMASSIMAVYEKAIGGF
jgi:hypothetical protein